MKHGLIEASETGMQLAFFQSLVLKWFTNIFIHDSIDQVSTSFQLVFGLISNCIYKSRICEFYSEAYVLYLLCFGCLMLRKILNC